MPTIWWRHHVFKSPAGVLVRYPSRWLATKQHRKRTRRIPRSSRPKADHSEVSEPSVWRKPTGVEEPKPLIQLSSGEPSCFGFQDGFFLRVERCCMMLPRSWVRHILHESAGFAKSISVDCRFASDFSKPSIPILSTRTCLARFAAPEDGIGKYHPPWNLDSVPGGCRIPR